MGLDCAEERVRSGRDATDEIIRNMSVETGIPEVHLHTAVPYGDSSNIALPTPANRAVVEASARHQRGLQNQAATEQMLAEQLALEYVLRIDTDSVLECGARASAPGRAGRLLGYARRHNLSYGCALRAVELGPVAPPPMPNVPC